MWSSINWPFYGLGRAGVRIPLAHSWRDYDSAGKNKININNNIFYIYSLDSIIYIFWYQPLKLKLFSFKIFLLYLVWFLISHLISFVSDGPNHSMTYTKKSRPNTEITKYKFWTYYTGTYLKFTKITNIIYASLQKHTT